jgi:hypothetical protein
MKQYSGPKPSFLTYIPIPGYTNQVTVQRHHSNRVANRAQLGKLLSLQEENAACEISLSQTPPGK